jgi:radical SAM protein (TIGR01212 family)
MDFLRKRYREPASYLAYFQAYSNTYASLKRLRSLYEEALSYPGITGLIIGTRPDCIDNEKLNYFRDLSEKHFVAIEFGVESCYDKTLKRINRGHSYSQAADAIKMTADKGIKTGAHFIFGLPGESREEMLAETEIISELPLHTVKFHQLQIIKGTIMEKEFLENPQDFNLFTFDDYVDFFILFLEKLNPQIVVERFTGEAPPGFLLEHKWNKKRTDEIVRIIERKLEELNTWQGRLYKTKDKSIKTKDKNVND